MKIDSLEVSVFEQRDELGKLAAGRAAAVIEDTVERKGHAAVMFASAASQIEFIRNLLKHQLPWRRITAFHMDEYIGLSSGDPRSFGAFLRRELFSLQSFGSVHYIASLESDPEQACSDYENLLLSQKLDLVCMGIGENGHIAFNDPPEARFDDPRLVRIVTLEERCRMQQVHDGCFSDILEVPRQAVTITIPALMSADHILCMVPGSAKAEAVFTMLTGPVESSCPASVLRTHPGASLFLDLDSAELFLKSRETRDD